MELGEGEKENSPPKMRPRCGNELQRADSGVRHCGVAVSSWLRATMCKPRWRCGEFEYEDEEKGSLVVTTGFLGIVPTVKHLVSNALKFFLD